MELSLQRPTVVITGAFNPAIFQPNWIARYLCNFQEGEVVETTQILALEGNAPQQITFIKNIGIVPEHNRLMIYLKNMDEETVEFGEVYCKRIFEHLPHTPFHQLGVNFQFSEAEPDEVIADKIESKEDLDRHYTIKEQRFTSVIQYAEDIDLNLQRAKSDAGLRFNFNYHHAKISPANADALFDGAIFRLLNHAEELLETIYKLEDYTTAAFDAQGETG